MHIRALRRGDRLCLRGLVGRPVERVEIEHDMGVDLQAGEWICFEPSEISLVDLPLGVRPVLAARSGLDEPEVIDRPGAVRRISVVRTAVARRIWPSVTILGVTLPPAIESARRVDPAAAPSDATVRIDTGVLFEFDSGCRILVYTDGIGFTIDGVAGDVAGTLERVYEGKYLLVPLSARRT